MYDNWLCKAHSAFRGLNGILLVDHLIVRYCFAVAKHLNLQGYFWFETTTTSLGTASTADVQTICWQSSTTHIHLDRILRIDHRLSDILLQDLQTLVGLFCLNLQHVHFELLLQSDQCGAVGCVEFLVLFCRIYHCKKVVQNFVQFFLHLCSMIGNSKRSINKQSRDVQRPGRALIITATRNLAVTLLQPLKKRLVVFSNASCDR